MAEGQQLPISTPSSPLEDGEFDPENFPTRKLVEVVTGQNHCQQAFPITKFHNHSPKPSYAAILQGQEQKPHSASIAQAQKLCQPSSDQLTMEHFRDPNSTILKPINTHLGKPAVHFLVSEKDALVEKLNLVLVGKFTHGRPPLSIIKTYFQNLKLQGTINVSLADSKHIFIEFSRLSDYYWMWLNLSLKIHGFDMRIFKWGADFSPRTESPIVPVWIRIVGMPLYLFDEMSLWQISGAIGKPIKIDTRNVSRSILSYARVCVELDISQPLSDTIWVCFKEEHSETIVESICLQVHYDVLPLFCTACAHVGHGEEMCKKKMIKGSLDSKNDHNVEPSVQKDNHSTAPVVAASCPATSQVVTVDQHSKRTVWMPVSKCSTAAILASETMLDGLNLQNGEVSKAFGKAEVNTSCEAKQPSGSETAAATVVENDAMHRNEASTDQDSTVETAAASGVETVQSSQTRTAAEQIALPTDQIENGHSPQNDNSDLRTKSDHAWHLVTGKRNKRTNEAQAEASSSLNKLKLQQANQNSNAKELVKMPIEQVSPSASSSVVMQSIIDLEAVEQKCLANTELQQETTQTKRHIQQQQLFKDHTKASQDHLHSSSSSATWADQMEKVDMKANTVVQAESPNNLHKQNYNNKSKGILGKGPIMKARFTKFGKLKYCDELEMNKRHNLFTYLKGRSRSQPPIKVIYNNREEYSENDLPFDFEQPVELIGEEPKSWTQAIAENILVARRSVPPKGRKSCKLSSLQTKCDIIDFFDNRAQLWDQENYDSKHFMLGVAGTFRLHFMPTPPPSRHTSSTTRSAPSQTIRRGRGRNRGRYMQGNGNRHS